MKFHFRFASILLLRRQQRDQAGAAVGQANEAIRRIDDQTDSIERERQTLRSGASGDRVGNVSVDTLLAGGRYDLQLQAQIQTLRETRDKLVQELDRRQAALVAAEAEVKRFEKLEEKDRAAFAAQLNLREQAEADDATSRRYTLDRLR